MKKNILIVLLLTLSFLLTGQSVGLVLSGGGAKGLAHIGVIKALEEYDIPIDYITGTSAGAIVGALYASGYSVDEMINICNSDIMDKYLKLTPDNNLGYLAKSLNESAGWFKFNFDFDSIFRFNFIRPNVFTSNNLDFGMIEFFAQSTAVCHGNFDDLMVKFRGIASSVNDNASYVFKSGNLDVAVRASMAFPFLFAPVQIDDKVLLDGGMYDNFPIDVMMEDFNPDIVIGSLVSKNYYPAKEDDIISIIQNVFMKDMDIKMPDNGILVRSGVLDIGLLDFDKLNQLVDSGYNACLEKIPDILDRINRKEDYQMRKDRRDNFNNKKPPLYFNNIIVDNLTPNQQKYIEVMMARKEKLLSPQEIFDNYSVLLSDDIISSVTPLAVYDDSTEHFDLHLKIKKNLRFHAELGGNLSIGGPSEAYLSFLTSGLDRYSWFFKVNSFIGTFYKSLGLSLRIDYPSKKLFYVLFDLGLNNKNFQKTISVLYNDAKPSYLIQNEAHGLAKFGISLTKRADLLFNLAYIYTKDKFYNINTFSKNDIYDEDIFTGETFGLRFINSTLNDNLFPTEGRSLVAKCDFVMGKETYKPGTTSLNEYFANKSRSWLNFNFNYDRYFKLSKIISLGLKFQGELSNQHLWANYTSSLLHANSFNPFDDARLRFIEENRAYNYAAAGLNVIASLPYNIMIKCGGYVFSPFFPVKELNDQQVEFGKFYERSHYLANISFIFRNKFAPLSLNFNFYDSSFIPFSITLNIGYILFNRYALD